MFSSGVDHRYKEASRDVLSMEKHIFTKKAIRGKKLTKKELTAQKVGITTGTKTSQNN